MKTLEGLLEEVAARDPDKASWFRWIRPNLGEDAVLALVQQYLAAPAASRGAAAAAGKGPQETLLDLEWDADPDEPTSMHEIVTDIATDG